jgi:hypothetical protein
LSPEMRKLLETDWAGLDSDTRSVYMTRLKHQTAQIIKDLTLIANKMPEKHLADITKGLTAERLKPLIRAILQPATGPYLPSRRLKKDDKQLWEQRRVRIQQICEVMIKELWDVTNAIAPNASHYLGAAHRGQQFTEGLSALLVGD